MHFLIGDHFQSLARSDQFRNDEQFSSASKFANPGSVRATGRVSPKLFELADRELEQITLKLTETSLQGPFGAIAPRKKNGHGLNGKHDYILLEYGTPGEWIMEEKAGDSSRGKADAGLHLTLETNTGDGEVRHQNNIKGPGVRWTMIQLLTILTKHVPDYDLLSANCWKYAFYCADAILNWCIGNAANENMRDELKRELEKLKHVERPMPKATMKWVMKPSDPESIKTGELIEQKLTHTVEKLKPDSLRCKMLSSVRDKVIDRNLEHRPAKETRFVDRS